jgi:hypothetical protein
LLDEQKWIARINDHFDNICQTGNSTANDFCAAAKTWLKNIWKENLESKYTRVLQFLNPHAADCVLVEKDMSLLGNIEKRISG